MIAKGQLGVHFHTKEGDGGCLSQGRKYTSLAAKGLAEGMTRLRCSPKLNGKIL